ncbi:MAG: hypothetical protein F6K47_19140 [Symploca sp. SIO2E6]|nr:hypothetical protein [Symploca sp. SIO2E6]
MANPVKRLHYFDQQFLREQDFIDEQNYHIQRQRDHNRLLHTPGIAQGLEIRDPPSGSTSVTVNPGIAYDHQGREIVLGNNQGINLESFADNQSVYLAITYTEEETDPSSQAGITANTRWTEAPAIETLLPNASGQFPEDPEEKIILAKVNRNGNQIATIDRTERRGAGVVGGDFVTNNLAVGGNLRVSGDLEVQGDIIASDKDNGKIQTTGMIRGASLPPNLIRNSYMNILDGDKPAGYNVGGKVTLEAAHPFTKGFEGPYLGTKPANAADSVDDATEENPYWFGRFNQGARIKRGGLANGWSTFPDGKILKITGDNSEQHTMIFFPFESQGNFFTKKVHLKAWLKISSGTQVGFGEVAGWSNGQPNNGLIITKEQSDNAPDGWYRVDGVISTSEITRLGGQSFSMGITGDETDGSFEVYLALPYLANLDYDTWLPSVSDMLSRNGLTVHPSSGNVGIGTTDPTEKLEVARGNVRIGGNLNVTGTITGKLSNGIVGNTQLANNSVTNAKIANNSINKSKFDTPTRNQFDAAIPNTGGSITGNLTVNSSNGVRAIQGTALGGTGDLYAGYFSATNTGNQQGFGVFGQVIGDGNGNKYGLFGNVIGGTTGSRYGVYGKASGGVTQYGGFFNAVNSNNGTAYGVWSSVEGNENGNKYGLYGRAIGGTTGSRYGVYGYANANGTNSKYGVRGYAGGNEGTKYAVYGSTGGSGTNYAGYFSGDVRVTGTLTKGGGSFLIDHPLEPFNKTLRHNFVESPEDLCLYRGKVKLNAEGSATVKMPDYFAALTKEEEATVNLTPIGKKPFLVSYQWSLDYTEFELFGQANAEVAYLVLANRDDPAIHQFRKPVEEEKGNGNFEQGKLLYPEAYSYPKEMGVDYLAEELVAAEECQLNVVG